MAAKQNADLCGNAARLPDERPACPPRIIVCEQGGRWATAIRRELQQWLTSSQWHMAFLKSVGWVERSKPHQEKRLKSGGARFARSTLQCCFPVFSDNLSFQNTFMEETRSLAECSESLRRSPAGFVVVELTPANVRRVLQFMCGLEWKYPLARLAVVVNAAESAEQSPRRLEALLLQAGAVFFADTIRGDGPRGVRALAGVALRHICRSPRPQASIREEIWARLPWGRH